VGGRGGQPPPQILADQLTLSRPGGTHYPHPVPVVPEPGGPGGPLAPPIFVRSVNPIRTGEGRLLPPITTGTPKVFHLPAALLSTTCPPGFFTLAACLRYGTIDDPGGILPQI
jgi:hypothetical protein